MIFVHVPKTAGTSIEAALGHHAGGVVRDAQDHRTLRQLQWPTTGLSQVTTAGNAREVALAVRSRLHPPAHPANRVRVTRAQFRSYFKFAVVRNPWDRMYSWYCNVRADALHRARLGVAPDVGFGEFVEQQLGADVLRPQLYWLVDFRGRVGVDMVCRFEDLDRDVSEACRRARIGEIDLPHLNATPRPAAYQSAYDHRTTRLVAERYREEIAMFDYRFDGSSARR